MASIVVLAAGLSIAVNAAAETRVVPMTADRWETVFGTMEFKEQNGAQAMVMTGEGAAAVSGLSFRNGTVEFEMEAERGGLVNVTRVYGLPIKRPARSFTWLKTTLRSTKDQSKTVAFGWSREVWVFVNGERVYADKNLFQPPAARKAPDGRLSLQNGSFVLPLKAGENDIAVALANNFYGWGLILRLENLDGITLARR